MQQERAAVRDGIKDRKKQCRNKTALSNNNFCLYIMYIYPGMLACHCEPSSRGLYVKSHVAAKTRKVGGLAKESEAAATRKILMEFTTVPISIFLIQ